MGVDEKLLKELSKFAIGDSGLDEIFSPLVEACRKVAKNDKEFIQCISEGIATLKSIIKKVK